MENKKSKSIFDRICSTINNVFRFLLSICFFWLLFSFIGYATDPATKNATKEIASTVVQDFAEPTITGTPEFEKEIAWSIGLMKENAPNHYNALCDNILDIKLSNDPSKPAFYAWTSSGDPTIYINEKPFYKTLERKTANPNDTVAMYYTYRTLAHETAHQMQFQNGQMTDTEEMEAQALAAERDALLKLGLSPETVKEIAGDHLLESEWWKD